MFSRYLQLHLCPILLPNWKVFYVWIMKKLFTTLSGTDKVAKDLNLAALPSFKD